MNKDTSTNNIGVLYKGCNDRYPKTESKKEVS